MLPKIIITVCFLAFFALHTEACYGGRRHRAGRGLNGFTPRNFEYACPKSGGQTVENFTLVPIATRLFKLLDMKLLPSREVCVLGEKLSSFILPEDLEFETMFSIAIFCSDCIQEERQSNISQCLEQKRRYIEWASTLKFKSLSELFVASIAHGLNTNQHEHLEK
jgi:hypothetical protein